MNFNSLYIVTIVILFSPLIGKLIKYSYDFYKLNTQFNSSFKLCDLLCRLTPKEFEIWVIEYLSLLGYENIVLTPSTKKIVCSKKGETYYVFCKKTEKDTFLSKEDIHELLGLLITESIQNGIIVTTGSVSDETKELLTNLPVIYSIEVISLSESDSYYEEFIAQTN